MKVAIVHYWLVGMRGGERVIEALCDLYPQADIFTHVYVPDMIRYYEGEDPIPNIGAGCMHLQLPFAVG